MFHSCSTKVLTASQMRRVDELTAEKGIPGLLLMENAGQALFRVLTVYFAEPQGHDVTIVCGTGNNGGDGFVLARQLLQRGGDPTVVLAGESSRIGGDAAASLAALRACGCHVLEVGSTEQWESVAHICEDADIVVDALLGTGLNKPLSGLYATIAEAISESAGFVLAVDVPTGMMSDLTRRPALSVQADATVTFTAPKIAHVLNEDQEAIGDLHVVPIGTPSALLDDPDHSVALLDGNVVSASLPPRLAASHKGTYGHAVIVAGGPGKSGAAVIAARAALRAGSGLVTVISPESIQPLVAVARPEIMTEGYPESGLQPDAVAEAWILKRLAKASAAALGPGMGTSDAVQKLIHGLVRNRECPLVLDADGLNACASVPEMLESSGRPPLILTPHPGEFARLTGEPVEELLAHPLDSTSAFATRYGVWLVFKNFRTLIAAPDGTHLISPTGNPGMASAGMGDCLSGVLAAQLGQLDGDSADAVTAAVSRAVYVHGLAGDLAADEGSEPSLTAGDVIEALPAAFRTLSGSP